VERSFFLAPLIVSASCHLSSLHELPHYLSLLFSSRTFFPSSAPRFSSPAPMLVFLRVAACDKMTPVSSVLSRSRYPVPFIFFRPLLLYEISSFPTRSLGGLSSPLPPLLAGPRSFVLHRHSFTPPVALCQPSRRPGRVSSRVFQFAFLDQQCPPPRVFRTLSFFAPRRGPSLMRFLFQRPDRWPFSKFHGSSS